MKSFLRYLTIPLTVVALSACSAQSADNNATSTPNSSAEDAHGLTIVSSTQVWADVASATVADANVSAIITGDSIDPHSFEPTAADMASVESADIIVVGGGGYDAWLYGALDENDPRIVHALDLSDHDHDHGDGAEDADDHEANEHIWYSTEAVSQVAEEIAEKAQDIDSSATVTPHNVTDKMDELHERIHALPAIRVAQTEPIADYIVQDSDMIESTPEGYRAATLSEGEASAADVAAFQEAITAGDIDLLIYNPQSATPVATSLRDLAKDNGVAIVEITETPATGVNFFDSFSTAVTNLETAAATAKTPAGV